MDTAFNEAAANMRQVVGLLVLTLTFIVVVGTLAFTIGNRRSE